MSKREKVMAVATVFVLAFGIVGTQLGERRAAITEKRAALKNLEQRLETQTEIIGMSGNWRERYDKVRDQMPVFEKGKQVDTYWLNIMDLTASANGVQINSRKALPENVLSDVFEFPIEARWEATLESFVKFMIAMQSEGAMLNVREIRLQTVANKQGFLQGTFTLYCAYMRGEKQEGLKPAPPPPAAAPAPIDIDDNDDDDIYSGDNMLDFLISSGASQSNTPPETPADDSPKTNSPAPAISPDPLDELIVMEVIESSPTPAGK